MDMLVLLKKKKILVERCRVSFRMCMCLFCSRFRAEIFHVQLRKKKQEKGVDLFVSVYVCMSEHRLLRVME